MDGMYSVVNIIRKKIRKEFTISSSSTSSAFMPNMDEGGISNGYVCLLHIFFSLSLSILCVSILLKRGKWVPVRGVAWMLLEVTVYEFIVFQIQPFIPSISICFFCFVQFFRYDQLTFFYAAVHLTTCDKLPR